MRNHVIILPNNKNIIMAAEQAVDLVEENMIVIPSKTIPQGIAALLAFNPDHSQEENQLAMNEALSRVKTGQITFAIRDTTIDGFTIKNGDFMGLEEGKIKVLDKNKLQAAKNLLTKIMDDGF